MGIGKGVRSEVVEWGILAMVIVIISVVLIQFKDISGVTSALNTTIDLIITGLSEPANWILIVIIGIIGFALIKMFSKKQQ